MAFSSLQEFRNRKMLPRETISLYLFELMRLLDQAMTGLAKEARDQLLIHQFLVYRTTGVNKSAVTSDR